MSSGRRTLVVMRHAKAEPYAETDARPPPDRAAGAADAAAAGRFLAAAGLVPDHALVSSAARTRETWAEVRDAARGGDSTVEVSRRRCTPPRRARRARGVRLVPDDADDVRLRRTQPDRGPRRRGCSTTARATPRCCAGCWRGFPTGGGRGLRAAGRWAELAEAGARLDHVPRRVTADRAAAQTGGAGVTKPASASAASTSSRLMPEQVDDRVEERHVDGGVRRLLHDRLGVERDARARPRRACRGRWPRRRPRRSPPADTPACGGEAAQRLGLAGAVDDRPDDPPGQPAVDDLELVGRGEVDAELLRRAGR